MRPTRGAPVRCRPFSACGCRPARHGPDAVRHRLDRQQTIAAFATTAFGTAAATSPSRSRGARAGDSSRRRSSRRAQRSASTWKFRNGGMFSGPAGQRDMHSIFSRRARQFGPIGSPAAPPDHKQRQAFADVGQRHLVAAVLYARFAVAGIGQIDLSSSPCARNRMRTRPILRRFDAVIHGVLEQWLQHQRRHL